MDSGGKDISKPLDPASFVSMLDSENIELFNRNQLSSSSNEISDINHGWLWFMEQKRLQYYRTRRRWSNVLTILFAIFFLCALLFLLMAISSPDSIDGETQLMVVSGGDDINGYYDDVVIDDDSLLLSRSVLDHSKQCLQVLPEERIDCNPDLPISREICLARGCCWLPTGQHDKKAPKNISSSSSTKAFPPLNVPYCFFGLEYRGYQLEKDIYSSKHLSVNKKIINLKRVRPSGFGRDVKNVKIEINELSSTVLRIKITDSDATRYEVPLPILNLPKTDANAPKIYQVEIYHSNSSLVVYRVNSMTPIFQVNLTRLIYSDQFIQITNKLSSDFIYGIGMLYYLLYSFLFFYYR